LISEVARSLPAFASPFPQSRDDHDNGDLDLHDDDVVATVVWPTIRVSWSRPKISIRLQGEAADRSIDAADGGEVGSLSNRDFSGGLDKVLPDLASTGCFVLRQ